MSDEKNWRERIRPVEWTDADEQQYILKRVNELERQILANDKALLRHVENKFNTLCDSINEVDARYQKECKLNRIHFYLFTLVFIVLHSVF